MSSGVSLTMVSRGRARSRGRANRRKRAARRVWREITTRRALPCLRPRALASIITPLASVHHHEVPAPETDPVCIPMSDWRSPVSSRSSIQLQRWERDVHVRSRRAGGGSLSHYLPQFRGHRTQWCVICCIPCALTQTACVAPNTPLPVTSERSPKTIYGIYGMISLAMCTRRFSRSRYPH